MIGYNPAVSKPKMISLSTKGIVLQEYVLIYAYDSIRNQVVFVEKDRPEWMRGKINLPGGKIESGETPEQAVIREFWEECGIRIATSHYDIPYYMGKIVGDWGVIHCCKVHLSQVIEIKPQQDETERFFWDFTELVIVDPRALPNLRIILPLMANSVLNWTITDNTPNDQHVDHRPYKIQIELED